jgi:hypothetical protein
MRPRALTLDRVADRAGALFPDVAVVRRMADRPLVRHTCAVAGRVADFSRSGGGWYDAAMATKAEQFRTLQQQRAAKEHAPAKAKTAAKKPKPAAEGAGAPGGTAERNRSARAGRKATAALEDSATRPARKSTRGSANRGKTSSNLERRETRKVRAPSARASRAAASRAGARKSR